jgi:hypothetical protein
MFHFLNSLLLQLILGSGVARWFISTPKIPIWVNFGMENVGMFYDQLNI